jgi:hypothetical protein
VLIAVRGEGLPGTADTLCNERQAGRAVRLTLGRSAGAANGRRSDAALVHRPVDRHQLHGCAEHLDEGHDHARRRAVGRDDQSFSVERKFEVVDLERDVGDGLDEIGIRSVRGMAPFRDRRSRHGYAARHPLGLTGRT